MGKPKITVVGIGPGSPEDITPAVLQAVKEADVVVSKRLTWLLAINTISSSFSSMSVKVVPVLIRA